MKNNLFKSITLIVLFFLTSATALAAVYPASNAEVITKQNVKKTVKVFTTNENGIFHADGLEEGTYDIYLYDEAHDPIAKAVPTKNGSITGRMLFQIRDGDNTKTDQKKFQPRAMNIFKSNNWDKDHLVKLKRILQAENILPQTLTAKDLAANLKDLKEMIKKFQKNHKLPVTGLIQKETLKKLNDIADDNEMWAGNGVTQ